MLTVRVPELGRVPRGYWIAWYESGSLSAVCLPFPLHLIARYARRAYLFLRGDYQPDAIERVRHEGYMRGLQHAYSLSNEAAYQRGVKEGYRQRQQQLEAFAEAFLSEKRA